MEKEINGGEKNRGQGSGVRRAIGGSFIRGLWSLIPVIFLLFAPPARAQFAQISRGPLQGVCNPRTLALDVVNNVVYSCGDPVNGAPASWSAIGGSSACPNCVLAPGGNATISGNMTAADYITSGLGPWNVVGACGTLGVSPGGQMMFGFDTGCLPAFSSGGQPVTLLAYQDGSGNVLQNANTASALAATPTQCAGTFATGVQANGTANCSTTTYIQLVQQACSALSGVAGYGLLCFDNSGALEININNAGWTQVGYSILAQSGDTLIQSDTSAAQTYILYASTDGTNYNRLRFALDGSNNNFVIASEDAGTPPVCGAGNCGIEFQIGSAVKWEIDSLGRLKPFADNTLDIGVNASLRARDVYAGRAFRSGTSSNTDSAGQIALSSATSNSYTFANTGYTSAPICTLTPDGDTTAVGVWWKTETTTVLTANVKTSGTITFDYVCVARN